MPIYKMEGKKNGQQKYRVRINYKDALGNDKQIDRVVYGSQEAKELEAKLVQELKNTKPESSMTVQNLFNEYTRYYKSEIRETTFEKKKQVLENHILPTLKNIKLSSLNAKVLRKWKEHIEEKGLSLKMKQNIYSELRALLNYAVKYGDLTSNPLSIVGNFKDAYSTPKTFDYYTKEEFLSFISVAKKYAEADKNSIYEWNFFVFFNIAFFTGMRKGEINALKWTDIDGDYIHITRSIAQKLSGDDRETPPKNKSSIRTLQIPIPLKRILDEHYERYKSAENFTDNWYICGGLRCLRDTTISKRNADYAKAANVKTIRIHDFRHSHASLLANEGINIQEIARRLGHSKIELTWNTYSHLYPREEEKAVKILNEIV